MNVRLTEEQKIKILNSRDIFSIMQKVLLRENKIRRNKEHFWIVGLATNNKIEFIELVSLGTLNTAIVEPMDVFRYPMLKGVAKIILVHNHPSGELRPSSEDENITDQLIQVGLLVNIPVIEHLIISTKGYYSFADTLLLETLKVKSNWKPTFKLVQEMEQKARDLAESKAEEIAKGMKERNVDYKIIMETTGLTREQVEGL